MVMLEQQSTNTADNTAQKALNKAKEASEKPKAAHTEIVAMKHDNRFCKEKH